MAELVTTFGGGPFPDRDRLHALTERFAGEPGEIRESVNSREPEALFQWLVAARDRYGIGQVKRHVCLHDEDVPDCSSAVVEG